MPHLNHANSEEEIERCFPVMAELRTQLQCGSFVALINQLFSEGYRLAYLEDQGRVVTVAGYRIATSLFMGKNLYLYDLVTTASARSSGFGKEMMACLREVAREHGCDYLHLDSGTQRLAAHRFYFREGLQISSFHFDEKLQ